MICRITRLRDMEIIDVQSGSRYGYMGDLEIDMESGKVQALIVPGRLRLFGLLGREKERVFPWKSVRCFGEDIILVEETEKQVEETGRKK